VEPESPAANASLLPGDILLGTEENHSRHSTISPALCKALARAWCVSRFCVEITSASAASPFSSVLSAFPGAPRRVIRVFLIAASPLARAALQNRLKAQSVKIVGSAASVDALGGDLSDSQADVLLVDASGEPPSPSSNRSPTRI